MDEAFRIMDEAFRIVGELSEIETIAVGLVFARSKFCVSDLEAEDGER